MHPCVGRLAMLSWPHVHLALLLGQGNCGTIVLLSGLMQLISCPAWVNFLTVLVVGLRHIMFTLFLLLLLY